MIGNITARIDDGSEHILIVKLGGNTRQVRTNISTKPCKPVASSATRREEKAASALEVCLSVVPVFHRFLLGPGPARTLDGLQCTKSGTGLKFSPGNISELGALIITHRPEMKISNVGKKAREAGSTGTL